MSFPKTWGVAWAALGLAACSPALNWREVRPEGSDLVAMFPCKPDRFVRQVPLAGARVEMHLVSCAVDGVSYAIVHARVAEPVQVGAALEALRESAAGNIGGQASAQAAFTVRGMTPSPLAVRFSAEGHGADGTPVREQAGVFARGLQVYQATVVGPALDPQATDTFFSGLRLGS
jgi:hypothetical protein